MINKPTGHPVMDQAQSILEQYRDKEFGLKQGLQAFALTMAEDKLKSLIQEMSDFESLAKGLSITIPDSQDRHPVEITYETLVRMRDSVLSSLQSTNDLLLQIGKEDPLYPEFENIQKWLMIYMERLNGKNDIQESGKLMSSLAESVGDLLKQAKQNKNPDWVRTEHEDLGGGRVRGTTAKWKDLNANEQQRFMALQTERMEPVRLTLHLCDTFIAGYKALNSKVQQGQVGELQTLSGELEKIALRCADANNQGDHTEDLEKRNFHTVVAPIIDLAKLASSLKAKDDAESGPDYIGKETLEARIDSILMQAKKISDQKFVTLAPDAVAGFTEAFEGKKTPKNAPSESAKKVTIQKQSYGIQSTLRYLFGLRR